MRHHFHIETLLMANPSSCDDVISRCRKIKAIRNTDGQLLPPLVDEIILRIEHPFHSHFFTSPVHNWKSRLIRLLQNWSSWKVFRLRFCLIWQRPLYVRRQLQIGSGRGTRTPIGLVAPRLTVWCITNYANPEYKIWCFGRELNPFVFHPTYLTTTGLQPMMGNPRH